MEKAIQYLLAGLVQINITAIFGSIESKDDLYSVAETIRTLGVLKILAVPNFWD